MMVGDGLNDAPMSRCRALTFHCIVSASTVIFADLPQPSDPTTETTSGGIILQPVHLGRPAWRSDRCL